MADYTVFRPDPEDDYDHWQLTNNPANCTSVRECAYRLYDILDDIDTAFDRFRGNANGLYNFIDAALKRRFECATPDEKAQDLVWHHD